jgi:hypothetical protein
MSNDDLRELVRKAKRVSLGSLDGIHDLIMDAEAYLGNCARDINGKPVPPVLDRATIEQALREAIRDRRSDQ